MHVPGSSPAPLDRLSDEPCDASSSGSHVVPATTRAEAPGDSVDPFSSPPPAAAPVPTAFATEGERPAPVPGPGRDEHATRLVWWLSPLLGAAFLVLGVGAFAGLAGLRKAPDETPVPERVFLAEVYEVETADLQEIVTGFGTARADREVLVSAQVSGEIVELHPRLRAGETVQPPGVVTSAADGTREHPGDVLVRIDDRPYRERFRQAESRLAEDSTEMQRLTVEEENTRRLLESARRDFETIQAEYDRIEKLRGTNAVTVSQLARAVVELRQFESKLIALQNEAGLYGVRREQIERRTAAHRIDKETAERDMRNTVVRPPFAGSLAEVHVDQGQYVRAAEPICRVVDAAHVEIAVPVVLADHARLSAELHAGRSPRVTLAENETAAPRWTGHLARVAPVADERTRTIRVYVDVDNAEQESPLLPGAFVHVRIAAGTLRQVRVVPRDVVRSGRTFVVGGERVEPREVRTGRTIGGLVVIESGLADGDRIPTTNLEALRPGAKIAPGGRRTLDGELARQVLHVVRVDRPASAAGPGPER